MFKPHRRLKYGQTRSKPQGKPHRGRSASTNASWSHKRRPDARTLSVSSMSAIERKYSELPSGFYAIKRMRKMRRNDLFSVLSRALQDFVETRLFRPGLPALLLMRR